MTKFFTRPGVPYLGQIAGMPVSLLAPSNEPPRACSLQFNWSLYGAGPSKPDVVVDVNLETGVVNPLDRIMSVYIDNTDSDITVYVKFPDTGFMVTAGPGALVYEPVITNTRRVQVIADGFTGTDLNTITTVQFANVYVAPNTNYERNVVHPKYLGSVLAGSPVANQQKYRDLAVGDQIWSTWISLDGSHSTMSTLTLTYPPGYYIYITNIQISMQDCRTSNTFIGSAYAAFYNLVGFSLYTPVIRRNGGVVSHLLNMSNSQIKIPCYDLFFSRVAMGVGDTIGMGAEGVTNTGPVIAHLTVNYSIVDERNT